jgi:hypothetical protein
MAAPENSLFGIEADEQAALDEFDKLRASLGQQMDEFMETHELSPGVAAQLLMELSISLHMADYMLSVEQPSASGLKLELDRLTREIADLVRAFKKTADEFVAASKQALADPGTEKL